MTSLDAAVQHILPERRLRIGRFDNLNDPFELQCVRMTESDKRKLFRTVREHWGNTFGVISFSLDWHSPVMWAHYARGHTGVCLGFDVAPDDWPLEVSYHPERLDIAIDLQKRNAGLTDQMVEQLLRTKYEHWSYENEYRVLAALQDPDKDGYCYFPFGENLSLKEIIVGARCNQPLGSFRKLLKGLPHPVTIRRARPAFDSFRIVTQKRVKSITIMPG